LISLLYDHTNQTFNQFFPNNLIPQHIKPSFITTQFYTGHGSFNCYLYRFNLSPTDSCSCHPLSKQNVEHLLLSCPNYYTTKQSLNLSHIDTLQDFVIDHSTHKNFILLCKSILDHLKCPQATS